MIQAAVQKSEGFCELYLLSPFPLDALASGTLTEKQSPDSQWVASCWEQEGSINAARRPNDRSIILKYSGFKF